MTGSRSHATAAVPFVAQVWAGMLVGVSFPATFIEFEAPSLSLPTAPDIGRATFRAFAWVKPGLALLLVAAVRMDPSARIARAGGQLATAMLALQTFWPLPALDCPGGGSHRRSNPAAVLAPRALRGGRDGRTPRPVRVLSAGWLEVVLGGSGNRNLASCASRSTRTTRSGC
jgi:hypothetical protein